MKITLVGAVSVALVLAATPAFAKHHHHHHSSAKSMKSSEPAGGMTKGTADSPPKAGNAGSQGESNGTSTPAGPANK